MYHHSVEKDGWLTWSAGSDTNAGRADGVVGPATSVLVTCVATGEPAAADAWPATVPAVATTAALMTAPMIIDYLRMPTIL